MEPSAIDKFTAKAQRNPRFPEVKDRLLSAPIRWEVLWDGRLLAYKALTPNPYLKRRPPLNYLQSLVEDDGGYIKAVAIKQYIDKYSQSLPQDVGDTVIAPKGKHLCVGTLVRAMQYADPDRDEVFKVAVCPSHWVAEEGDTIYVSQYALLGAYGSGIHRPNTGAGVSDEF